MVSQSTGYETIQPRSYSGRYQPKLSEIAKAIIRSAPVGQVRALARHYGVNRRTIQRIRAQA